jgi:hypothetical protein
MRNGGWRAGPIIVLTAALVGLSSCSDAAPARPSPPGPRYPTMTVAPTPASHPPSAAISSPITGRSPATTTIAG